MNVKTPKKYCLGGFVLPLRLEFDDIRKEKCKVIDSKGKLVKKFNHWMNAQSFMEKYELS